MIAVSELDAFLYEVASIIAVGGYATYHCYFTGKETYIVV
jgi:hypothetical protein